MIPRRTGRRGGTGAPSPTEPEQVLAGQRAPGQDQPRADRHVGELERIRAEAERLVTSAQRDDVATERDRAAELREGSARRAEAAMLAADPGNTALRAVVARSTDLRDQAMADRRRAAADRQRAAEDRHAAAAAQRQARIDVQRAQVDGATGVYARQIGYAALRGEIDRCRRRDDPFVLTAIGVAHVTTLRARQGEQAAEALVDSVIRALRAGLRSYDPVVRVSADGFLCGLPGTEPGAAVQRVDDIRVMVRLGHPPGSITVGFATLDAGDTLDSLVVRAQADMALDREP